VGGQTATAQCTNWDTFRASLATCGYNSVTIKGTNDTVGVTCTDSGAPDQIAALLKSGTDGSVTCGTRTWRVGACIGIELNAANVTCECETPGYTVRPCVGNFNWGGVNTATCSAPSQTMTVTFSP
jgi:hypothetical protein